MLRSRKVLLYLGIIGVSWILILFIPKLHTMFLAQSIDGGSSALPSAVPSQEPNFTQLAQKNPHNLALRLAKISQQMRLKKSRKGGYSTDSNIPDVKLPERKGFQKELERLVRDFPNSPLPVYALLSYSMRKMRPIRGAGRLSDPDLIEHKKEGVPSPERRGKRNYTPQQWRRVIALCKKGEKISPKNGIFDMLEAYWQFAEFHDKKGWAALKRAVQKPAITRYRLKYGKKGREAYKTGLGRNLMWEEIYKATSLLSESFTDRGISMRLRSFTRWLVWDGVKQEEQGNHARALEMYGLTLRMVLRRKQSVGSFVEAFGLEDLAISGPRAAGVKPDKPIDEKVRAHQFRNACLAFSQYAKEHGRPDIARYGTIAVKNQEARMALAENRTMGNQRRPYWLLALMGFLLWRMGILLLWFLVAAVIIGVVASLASKVLFDNTDKPHAYKEYDFWRGAISFAALPASLILIVGYAIPLCWKVIHYSHGYYIDFASLPLFANHHTSPVVMAIVGLFTPAVFGVAYCWKRAARENQKLPEKKVLLRRVLGVIGSLIFVILWATLASGQLPFPVSRNFSDFVYTYVVGGTPSLGNGIGNPYFFLSLICIVVVSLIYLANVVSKARKNNTKSTFADFTHLLAHSSLRFVAIGSVIYLLSLVIAIPVRAPIHKREMIKATQGQMVFYREALERWKDAQ